MNIKGECNRDEVVLDENGNVDLEFYYMQAEKMRAEYISSIFNSGIAPIKAVLRFIVEKTMCPKCLFSH